MRNKSKAGQFREWSAAMRAVRKNKARLGGVEPFLGNLEKAYYTAATNQNQCEVLRLASREATQQLRASLGEGQDAASRLRSFIKSKLGFHSEQLLAYGIQPRRRRRRSATRKGAGEEIAN